MHRAPERRPVRRRTARAGVALAMAVPLALAACGQAEDAARGAASDAASSAGDSVRRAATDQVLGRVCDATTGSGPLADVRLSEGERTAVGRLATAASAAGVPQQYVDPLRQIAASKDSQDVGNAIDSLRKACADRPSAS